MEILLRYDEENSGWVVASRTKPCFYQPADKMVTILHDIFDHVQVCHEMEPPTLELIAIGTRLFASGSTVNHPFVSIVQDYLGRDLEIAADNVQKMNLWELDKDYRLLKARDYRISKEAISLYETTVKRNKAGWSTVYYYAMSVDSFRLWDSDYLYSALLYGFAMGHMTYRTPDNMVSLRSAVQERLLFALGTDISPCKIVLNTQKGTFKLYKKVKGKWLLF